MPKNMYQKLVIEFIDGFCEQMRTAFGNIIHIRGGSCPADTVGDYLLNIRVVEGAAAFMTGLEVKHLSRASEEACSRAEYVAVLIPTAEQKRVGLRDIEGLAVKLLFLNEEMVGDTLSDGVLRHEIPDDLLLISAPGKIAVCADDSAEGLGVVG